MLYSYNYIFLYSLFVETSFTCPKVIRFKAFRGLDLLNQWLLQRDGESEQLAQRLTALESMIQQCHENLSAKQGVEAFSCCSTSFILR